MGTIIEEVKSKTTQDLERLLKFFTAQKAVGNFDSRTMAAMLAVMGEINERQGKQLEDLINK